MTGAFWAMDDRGSWEQHAGQVLTTGEGFLTDRPPAPWPSAATPSPAAVNGQYDTKEPRPDGGGDQEDGRWADRADLAARGGADGVTSRPPAGFSTASAQQA